jgi:hypothetical protein
MLTQSLDVATEGIQWMLKSYESAFGLYHSFFVHHMRGQAFGMGNAHLDLMISGKEHGNANACNFIDNLTISTS